MKTKEQETALLATLTGKIDTEELLLITLQGMIAAEISMRRQELGLSQKDFAENMGVTQSLVSRWENGDTNYTLHTLVKICSFLGLEMQSPVVPASVKVYSVGDSNIYAMPTAGTWKNNTFSTKYISIYSSDEEQKEM